MVDQAAIFQSYWENWLPLCPSAQRIFDLLTSRGETIVNDHIALRTLRHPEIGIDRLALPFLEAGYSFAGEYKFDAKKLYAQHLEIASDPLAPKVFISELLTEELPNNCQAILTEVARSISQNLAGSDDSLGYSGRCWGFRRSTYDELAQSSEYASWFYAFGFRANHFTISVNHLDSIDSIEAMNELLTTNDFKLNTSGGAVKGTPAELLVQSSTLSDHVQINDDAGSAHEIPGCYVEFAKRYPDPRGRIYTGFVTASADKIFESTNAASD